VPELEYNKSTKEMGEIKNYLIELYLGIHIEFNSTDQELKDYLPGLNDGRMLTREKLNGGSSPKKILLLFSVGLMLRGLLTQKMPIEYSSGCLNLFLMTKENCSHYIYKKEDKKGFNPSLLHNRNRIENGIITYTNLYLDKVYIAISFTIKILEMPSLLSLDIFFSTVFDYAL